MKSSKFKQKVLETVKTVPPGKVVSYGQVALMVGVPRAAQAVGQVLHSSGEDVPWWRVINNAGRISTTCLEHSAVMQRKLLIKDGVKVTKKLKIDIEKYRYRPSPNILKKLKLSDEYVEKIVQKYLWGFTLDGRK